MRTTAENEWAHQVATKASLDASKNSAFDEAQRTPPQLLYAPILWAIQDGLDNLPTLLTALRESGEAIENYTKVRSALLSLVEIDRADAKTDPDVAATDEWRETAMSIAHKAISETRALKPEPPR